MTLAAARSFIRADLLATLGEPVTLPASLGVAAGIPAPAAPPPTPWPETGAPLRLRQQTNEGLLVAPEIAAQLRERDRLAWRNAYWLIARIEAPLASGLVRLALVRASAPDPEPEAAP